MSDCDRLLDSQLGNSYSTSPLNRRKEQNQKKKQKQCRSIWLRKPMWAVTEESFQSVDEDLEGSTSPGSITRHLTLFDLVSIGVGATIGSGVFVLCGLIAHEYTGPATFISWGIAGLCASFSGLCYAELSGKFAVSGSSYSYVYVAMGELPAMVAAACLSLEYVFSAAAVSRSWGDKVVAYLKDIWQDSPTWVLTLLEPGYNINPSAFAVATITVALLLNGVKESQKITNFFTVFKCLLVVFMCAAAFTLAQPKNFTPLFPAQFGGIVGVMRGTTSSFFGYIGYDEICCLAGEALEPSRNLPRAVMGTILIVTVLYVLAAIALVGMVPYEYVSVTSGFPDGFRYRNADVFAQITALGELFTLPVVVLVTIMAQPRLQFAMAKDGLLPPIFSEVDQSGNIWKGTLISGCLMVAISTCIPFTYLNDLISAGILVAFSLTDGCVILLRQRNPEGHPHLIQSLLFVFNILSLVMGMSLKFETETTMGRVSGGIILLLLLAIGFAIGKWCPAQPKSQSDCFEIPSTFVPYLPLIGQFLNWYLVGQLEIEGILLLIGYISLSIVFYFVYGAHHSHGNTVGWGHETTSSTGSQTEENQRYGQKMVTSDSVSDDGISLGSVDSNDDGISLEDEGRGHDDS